MIIILAVIGLVLNFLAWKKGFYTLPEEQKRGLCFFTIKHILAFFFIYLASTFFIPPFLAHLTFFKKLTPYASLGWIQAITLSIALGMLHLYSYTLKPTQIKAVWKAAPKKAPSRLQDLKVGVFSWFLIFPIISVIGELVDNVLKKLYEMESYEQIAVRFLKMTINDPLSLAVTLITIVIIAPILEEFLFRGVLQSYLKKYLGRKSGIAITSLIFALFHLAPSQGAGNISLIILLFALACFLGFLYEKRKSLYSPIGLHMTFNLMTALRVIFMKEGS